MKIEKSVLWTHEQAVEAWAFYQQSVHAMNPLAATRHAMHNDEFNHYAQNPAIEKYTAFDDDGRIVALSMQTNCLEEWPVLSVDFFMRKWPELVAENSLWYVVFVASSPQGGELGAFGAVLDAMTDGRRDDCVWAMDFCAFNLERGILELIRKRLRAIDPRVTTRKVDVQEWYVVGFGEQA